MKRILPPLFAGVGVFAICCAIDAWRGDDVMVIVNSVCGVIGAVAYAVTDGWNP